jgi:hypothetical protein
MAQSIEHEIISRIYGKGRGWVFSKKDFARLGSPESLDLALHRLLKKGTLRRVLRGCTITPNLVSFSLSG